MHGALPPEDAAAEQDEPGVLEHAELPSVLVRHVASRLLPSDRGRVDDRTPAPLRQEVWEDDVVSEPRIELDVVVAAHGVDRPDAAGDRTDPRLVLAQPAF